MKKMIKNSLAAILLANCFMLAQNFKCTNEWIVKIDDKSKVESIANATGLLNKGQVKPFENVYKFVNPKIKNTFTDCDKNFTDLLNSFSDVTWSEHQVAKTRTKRNFIDNRLSKRSQDLAYSRFVLNDPFWKKEWYLKHDLKRDRYHKLDLHVIPVWDMGFTGKGVVVGVLDDGLEWNHTDIFSNYDPKASYDFVDYDSDPMPFYESTDYNKHGTECAGAIAMIANNSFCGVGIAFKAKVGGIRLLNDAVTDIMEAQAMTFNLNYIDILTSSWGPLDNGEILEGPGTLASEAFIKGITEGRNGKGVIYVWASGNGGQNNDHCNCDGYSSSIYSISISAVTSDQEAPYYAEYCSSTLASTYSNGWNWNRNIVSISLHNQCTESFGGTSAAAPIAAGIFALVLEANPNLTWRDMQHLVAWTSSYKPLVKKTNLPWKTNAAGFKFNPQFGFGLLNAVELVRYALKWKTVPEKRICKIVPLDFAPVDIFSGEVVELDIKSNSCEDSDFNHIRYLEHLQLFISADYSKRGDLTISIESPQGTDTVLLNARHNDYDNIEGIQNWPFVSVHTWGEDPTGVWKIRVNDSSNNDNSGRLTDLKLVLHGTHQKPDYIKYGRNKISE